MGSFCSKKSSDKQPDNINDRTQSCKSCQASYNTIIIEETIDTVKQSSDKTLDPGLVTNTKCNGSAPGTICCEAIIPSCMGCNNGCTAEEYCMENPNHDACKKKNCCEDLTAECESCKHGVKIEEYCEIYKSKYGEKKLWKERCYIIIENKKKRAMEKALGSMEKKRSKKKDTWVYK